MSPAKLITSASDTRCSAHHVRVRAELTPLPGISHGRQNPAGPTLSAEDFHDN